MKKIKKIAVVGLGLLGGSICKSVKKRDSSVYVSAFGRNIRSLDPAVSDGSADSAAELDSIIPDDFDLIIVSVPVESSVAIIKNILDRMNKNGSILIDVGSVKGAISDSVKIHKNSSRFIGCHPMAGSEKTGYISSTDDLYTGSTVIITPTELNSAEDLDAVKKFWGWLGASVIISDPHTHDKIVSFTSHMPHVVSSAVSRALSDFESAGTQEPINGFIGNGLRDVTRISAGSPEMWRDIVMLNGDNIINALDAVISDLDFFKKMIKFSESKSDDLIEYFSRARDFRKGIK